MSEYRCIVADPPWRYTQNPPPRTGCGVSAEHQYSTMTTEELSRLEIPSTAHLYVWVTNPVLLGMRPSIMGNLSAPGLCRSWGFEPKALITWVKTAASTGEATRGGMGWYFRGATEHAIFAVKGVAPIPAALRQPNIFYAPKGKHSEKPEEFYRLVERVSPGPYLEMFARRNREGWDGWGDEYPPKASR